jgi:hypothetical protein
MKMRQGKKEAELKEERMVKLCLTEPCLFGEMTMQQHLRVHSLLQRRQKATESEVL